MQRKHDLAKKELLHFEGLITETLPDARSLIELETATRLLPIRPGE